MQDTIAVLVMAFGTALISASGASELAVAIIVAAGLLAMALRSLAPHHHHHHHDDDAVHHSGNVRSRRS
jgi:hypothetical protein